MEKEILKEKYNFFTKKEQPKKELLIKNKYDYISTYISLFFMYPLIMVVFSHFIKFPLLNKVIELLQTNESQKAIQLLVLSNMFFLFVFEWIKMLFNDKIDFKSEVKNLIGVAIKVMSIYFVYILSVKYFSVSLKYILNSIGI